MLNIIKSRKVINENEVEQKHDLHVKRLRMNKGGKYYDPSYFQSNSIIHETTTGYAPQSNDVAERKNRTLKK